MTNALLNPSDLMMSAELSLTSNGAGAKSAKVTLIARSGDAVEIKGWGRVVHDFSGMSHKAKIPLDWEHDQSDSNGWLNKFDTSSGDLVCSGAIVIADEQTAALVTKMTAGVPFEASIQFNEDCLMEFVPEGFSVNVNGRDIAGPVTVVREWSLKAVAIVKFGKDRNTSAEVFFSERKVDNKNSGKGFFVRFAKSPCMGAIPMNEDQKPVAIESQAVETKAEAEAVKVEAVEADVKAEQTVTDEVKAEAVTTEVVEAVEAVKTEQTVEAVMEQVAEAVEASADPVAVAMSALSKPVDPRSEFKQFVELFGAEKAAVYFSEGKSFDAAKDEHLKFLSQQNVELTKRLTAIDRGADKPVKFSDRSDASEKKIGSIKDVIRFAGQK
jgi:hypothetical protein